MKDIECPYCQHEQDVNHDDGQGYDESTLHEMECEKCEKNFVFNTSISFYYEPHKADCLNCEPHNYERTHTIPKEFSKMRCNDCGDEREMTEEERKGFEIDTKEEYFVKLKASQEQL